jgi:hypothetical protein
VINGPWPAAALTAATFALSGLRAGLHWDLPGMLLFTAGLAVLAVTDVCWWAAVSSGAMHRGKRDH